MIGLVLGVEEDVQLLPVVVVLLQEEVSGEIGHQVVSMTPFIWKVQLNLHLRCMSQVPVAQKLQVLLNISHFLFLLLWIQNHCPAFWSFSLWIH